jgi:hypothetical protein
MARVKVLLAFLILLFCSLTSHAQQPEKSEVMQKRQLTVNNAVLIGISYNALFPVGELSKRFGFSSSIGLNISYKMKKNWLIGVEGAYIWSRIVKENGILDSITTYATGQIIGNDGSLYNVPMQLSGFEVALRVGKLIPTSSKHPNSGVLIEVAPGFIEHKIWMNVNSTNLPQLSSDYLKGYDRLTNGPMINGFLGYLYLERHKFISLKAGLDYTLGFTQNRRPWNFDTMAPDHHQRLDMFIGLKLVWVIPIFTNKDNEVYYN